MTSIKEMDRHRLRIKIGSQDFKLSETARADFNGDGLEDILVNAEYYAGSDNKASTYTLLTRTSPDGKFERIHEQPDKQPDKE